MKDDKKQAIVQAVHATGQQHGVNTKKHEKYIVQAMASPPVADVLAMVDDAKKNPAKRGQITADGDDMLRTTLATVLAVCEHTRDENKQAGGTPSEFLARTIAALQGAVASK